MSHSIYSQNRWVDKFMYSEPSDACDEARVKKISCMIPAHVRSVLDVGVGGGYIYRELKRKDGIKCFGLDISFELVRRLQENGVCVGDARAIPFGDAKFDLVLAADVIEHISEEHFRDSIAELGRVADKYILINSPYKDSIHWPVSLCSRCDKEFNIYGHIRKMDMALIRRIFPKDRFDIIKVEFFGNRRSARPRFLVGIARKFGRVYSAEGAVCPHCFNVNIAQPERNILQRCFGGAICAMFFLMDNFTPAFIKTRSEMRVLLRKKVRRNEIQ